MRVSYVVAAYALVTGALYSVSARIFYLRGKNSLESLTTSTFVGTGMLLIYFVLFWDII